MFDLKQNYKFVQSKKLNNKVSVEGTKYPGIFQELLGKRLKWQEIYKKKNCNSSKINNV